jgi:hypothetical protein
MDRKRTVAAAGGISAILVAGSSAFALSNGIFVAQPAHRDASLQALQARLVPETGAPPKVVLAPRVRRAKPHVASTGGTRTASVRSAPQLTPERAVAPAAIPVMAAAPAPIPHPTTIPAIARVTAPVVAHSAASVVPSQSESDDHELEREEGAHGDD